ncbi:hypothetical protein FOMPIDRAFT_1056469 [Fomitopsis schrenkii]|uniref:F-box domain-containing protein n=1 Tax=Fomitopsis schrenkii TaxID=2126942 RepID=S8ET41_FOMSC|nr:hypothetical protein FOMPIDRAFT_1056469 [Fomitopsis schrenkii]
MPLDILAEIFSHLFPQDLINLARTTKAFRTLLMHRGSAHFWRASRRLAGLPDLPQRLSEPAYASFVYSNHCHNCFKQNVKSSVIWQIAVRYCRACKDTLTVKATKSDPDLESVFANVGSLSRSVLNVAPVKLSSGVLKVIGFYHRPQLIEIRTQWEKLHTNDEEWRAYVKQQQNKAEAIQNVR